ncbi:MAG: methyltetrahydrofolate--corrinoid methyltransferase [Spirochaeta sp.]|nr:methyltetrahydrofolate--corrinoid methyltransferase [Spirochaeta sp.]
MIFIGERINTGFKVIKNAVLNKDGDVIKEWARKQADAKADYLDVNLGAVSNKPEDLCWMIEKVQEEVDLPISIDTNKLTMLKEAIPVCKKPPLVNSVTADEEKLDKILPIIAQYNASIIGLVMDESGSPKSADQRVENAGRIMAKIMDYDISPEKLFLDPIVMPLKFMQDQSKEILKAASQFGLFSDPPCHIVCGLSNVSNGTSQKKLINRVFATMLIANGLDAVILDVADEELVNTILTAELIMNKSIYADSYIDAFRK